MTYTLRLLKLPERAIREEATYPDILAALKADDYALIAGGSYAVEITDDETGVLVHQRQITGQIGGLA